MENLGGAGSARGRGKVSYGDDYDEVHDAYDADDACVGDDADDSGAGVSEEQIQL